MKRMKSVKYVHLGRYTNHKSGFYLFKKKTISATRSAYLMLICAIKIQLWRFNLKLFYFIFDFQKSHLRLTKVITRYYSLSFIQHKYNGNLILHTHPRLIL